MPYNIRNTKARLVEMSGARDLGFTIYNSGVEGRAVVLADDAKLSPGELSQYIENKPELAETGLAYAFVSGPHGAVEHRAILCDNHGNWYRPVIAEYGMRVAAYTPVL